MQGTKPKDQLLLAIAFACVNAAMLGFMGLFAKLLSEYFGPIEVTFFRNFVSLIALALWLVFAGKLVLLKTRRPGAHVFRGLIGTTGITCGMLAVSILPLAETTILLFTSPLWTLIFSWVFLKETIGPYRISAIIMGFIGIVIMANPSDGALALPLLGLIAGLAWGLCSGAVDTTLRWMGSTENASTTTFYFMLMGSLLTALHWPFAELKDNSFSIEALWMMCGLGIVGLIALLTKTQSFRLGEASVIAPIMYTMILWSVLMDYLFWDVIPGWNVILGGAIIIGSNLFVLYRENLKQRLKAQNKA